MEGGSDSLWAAITEEVVAYKQPVQAVLDKQAAQFNDAVGDAVDRLSSCLGTRPRGDDVGTAAALNNDISNGNLVEGNRMIDSGEYANALTTFDAGLALTPDRVTLLEGRATALVAMDRLDEGAQACVRAVSVDPRYAPARERLAALCVHPRGFEAAFKAAQAEQAARPSAAVSTLVEQLQITAFAHTSANHEFSRDRLKEAEAALCRGVETAEVLNPVGMPPAPGAAVLYANRAAVRIQLQLYKEAKDDADMALRCVPGFQKAEKLREEAAVLLKGLLADHRAYGREVKGRFKPIGGGD